MLPKRTIAASRGFLATARLSCLVIQLYYVHIRLKDRMVCTVVCTVGNGEVNTFHIMQYNPSLSVIVDSRRKFQSLCRLLERHFQRLKVTFHSRSSLFTKVPTQCRVGHVVWLLVLSVRFIQHTSTPWYKIQISADCSQLEHNIATETEKNDWFSADIYWVLNDNNKIALFHVLSWHQNYHWGKKRSDVTNRWQTCCTGTQIELF